MTELTQNFLPEADLDGVELSDGELELSDRASLRRVAGLSTELADVTEVEYRQLRLERVVLVGVWTEGTRNRPRSRWPNWRAWPRRRAPRCSKAWSSVVHGRTPPPTSGRAR